MLLPEYGQRVAQNGALCSRFGGQYATEIQVGSVCQFRPAG